MQMPSNTTHLKTAFTIGLLVACALSTSCQSFNIKQAAYSALRTEDCQRNEVNVFCSRASFHHEYDEYERVRNEYLYGYGNGTDSTDKTFVQDPIEVRESILPLELEPTWAIFPQNSTES